MVRFVLPAHSRDVSGWVRLQRWDLMWCAKVDQHMNYPHSHTHTPQAAFSFWLLKATAMPLLCIDHMAHSPNECIFQAKSTINGDPHELCDKTDMQTFIC